MELFTKTVKDYVTLLVNEALFDEDSSELRIFTQSIPPGPVYQIFEGVRDFLDSKTDRVRCEMRVAKGLYEYWGATGADSVEIDRLLQGGWIDMEDRLTHYRNLSRGPDEDLLLVILIGIDHATDRGGLADFYTLTDAAIFRDRMGGSYEDWIKDILVQANLADTTGAASRDFDEFLRKLFQIRPRNLVALSEFLSEVLLPKAKNCDNASELLGLAFEQLPFWGVPPLFSPANPAKRTSLLAEATRIFDRDPYREKRERKKAFQSIEQAKDELGVPPQTTAGVTYVGVDDFLTTLEEFIETGSREARASLLHTDFSVVTQILGRRPLQKSKSKPAREEPLRGPGLQVFLRAIHAGLCEFASACGRGWAPGHLQKVELAIESFEFDGTEDDQDVDAAGAEEVFRGLVGGLDAFLKDFKIPLQTESGEDTDLPEVAINCSFGYLDDDVKITSKRLKESRLRFRVQIKGDTGDLSVTRKFVWVLPPNHEERVRLTSARLMAKEMRDPGMRLPVVQLDSTLDELYFALDEGEAHRMFASGLSRASYMDALANLSSEDLGSEMAAALAELSAAYSRFLEELQKGYYLALDKPLRDLVKRYKSAVDLALKRDAENEAYGDELLRRLYQAFMCVPAGTPTTSAFVPAMLGTGITPAIAETIQAREIFLREGYLQVARRLLENGLRAGNAQFDRLLGLVELRRPLYGLVFDSSRRLTTNLRSFGLLHRLGERPKAAPTLEAQAEMRAEDMSDGGNLSEYRQISPESRVITRTLLDYREVHPYVADRMAILAANVEDLRPLIAGVHAFLSRELKEQTEGVTVPYELIVWIIGRGPSPTAAQEVLRRWRESWSEENNRKVRSCRLTIAYRPARSRKEVLTLLEAVDKQHDVGFLFNFLNDQTGGDSIVPAREFEHDWREGGIGKFPISEYPRPVRPTDPHIRQGQVSNRRFQLAARHAEITARLKNPEHPGEHHLIFNQVEFGERERRMTRRMHSLARWVACVDRFVDKALILGADSDSEDQRKLVGFTSGVGGYGELNVTLSTERGSAGELLNGTARQLKLIYRDWSADDCRLAAGRLVTEAQLVTGLSLVRALGNEGVMRDVIGYAIANRIYLGPSQAVLCAAIPLDSFPHWFHGAEHGFVPDLLLLEAHLREGRFIVEATVVECKVGKQSPTHVEEAVIQAAAGVEHLGRLFLPNSVREWSSEFDRRYWWAQLHRALVVRNVRAIAPEVERDVDLALEQLAEGTFDIHWRAIAATFWTNDADEAPILRKTRSVEPLPGAGSAPLEVYHASVGQQTTLEALKAPQPDLREQLRPASAAEIGSSHSINDGPVEEIAPGDRAKGDSETWPQSVGGSVGVEGVSPDGGTSEMRVSPATNAFDKPETETDPGSKDKSEAEPSDGEKESSDRPGGQAVAMTSGAPERILLGSPHMSQGGDGAPVYWEYSHPQLPNRHLLVFGNSGQGKTYAIQALLLEMAKAGQASLVIDYTDGFLPQHLEPELRETVHPETFALAAGRKLPLDPFRLQSDELEGIGPIQEKPFEVAKRVTSIFTAVYTTMGEQQRATLVEKIERGLESGGLSLQALYEQLRDEGEDLLANKLMPLARTEPFTSADDREAWATLFESEGSRVNILQLARIDKDVQRLIIEFVLWDLWDFLRRTGRKDHPRPVVLDEVQNLDHRSGSPLEKYLREGRKFGASMILATQTMSNFKAEERDRLFQAAHMLFFKPADTELRSFANVLRDRSPGTSAEDWSRQLSSLNKGECLSVGFERRPDGSLRSQVRRVAITPLADRMEER
jgi:DNA phosphorothioation-dependent restriction protein DptH